MSTSLRVAGWGTLGFAIAFFTTFAVNALINVVVDYPDQPLAADMQADFVGGLVGIVLWTATGSALCLAAVALGPVAWREGSFPARICTAFGVVATAGWMLSGANIAAQRSPMLNGSIIAAHADPAAERAVIEGLYVGVHSGGILFAVAAVPWLGMAAIGVAKRVSKAVSALLWIAALASFAGYAILGAQYGFLVVMVCFAVVGPLLLRHGRRAAQDPPHAATVAASSVAA